MRWIRIVLFAALMSGCAGYSGYFGGGYPPGRVYGGAPVYGGFAWGGYGYPGRYAYPGWRPNNGYSPWHVWNRGPNWRGPALGFRRPYPGPGFAPGWRARPYRGWRGGFG